MTQSLKITKKIALVLALALVIAFAGILVFGNRVRADENGPGWILTDSGVLTITDGDAFVDGNDLWKQSNIAITSVVIDCNISYIPDGTFRDNKTLVSVDLGSVKSIGDYAFYACSALKTIDLSNVEYIGEDAFYNCVALTSIDISSATVLDTRAFFQCQNLESVTADELLSIGEVAFARCYELSSFTFKNSSKVTEIGESCFDGCKKLTSLDLHNVTEIPAFAFNHCELLSDLKLGTVTSVGRMSFWYCYALPSFDVSHITVFPESCFGYCEAFTYADLSNATSIGRGAFSGCTNLSNVVSLSNVTDLEAFAFNNCETLSTVIDLRNINTVKENTFNCCFALEKVYLSEENDVIIDKCAFKDCRNLTDVSGKNIVSVGKEAFDSCYKLTNIDLSKAVYVCNSAFSGCYKLIAVDLSSAQVIEKYAFNACKALQGVTLGANINTIEECVFKGCAKLETINLENISYIDKNAFKNCTSLTGVDLRYTSVIEEGAFNGCTNLKDLTLGYRLGYMITGASDPSLCSFEYDSLQTVYFFGPKRLYEERGIANYFPNATITYGGAYDVYYCYGNSSDIRVIEEGNQAPELTNPTAPNASAIFVGWFTDKDYKNAYDFSLPVTCDITIYACFIKDISRDVFKGYTLSLGGDIGVNFYTLMPEDAVGDRDYVKFTIDDIAEPQIIYVRDARTVVKDGVTYYVFDCQVPAKNMTSTVYADFYMDGQRVGRNWYSVKNYADYILMNQTYYKDAVPLVTAMLNYGAYAQLYFGYKTDDLANDGVYNGNYDFDSVTASMINRPYDSSKTNLPAGLTASSASMILDSNTTLKIYFTDNTNKKLTFKLVDGDREITLRPSVSGGQKVIRITGISADKLNDDFKIKVYVEGDSNEYSFTYSPMTYAYNVLNREPDAVRTEELRNLMKAFYLYNQAAKAYQNI